jgi:hypothetical protein
VLSQNGGGPLKQSGDDREIIAERQSEGKRERERERGITVELLNRHNELVRPPYFISPGLIDRTPTSSPNNSCRKQNR